MRIIKDIFNILTFPFFLLYLGFSAGIFAYFEELEDEYCELTSDKKDSP